MVEDFPVHFYAQSSYLSTDENSLEDSYQSVERMDDERGRLVFADDSGGGFEPEAIL